MRWWWLSNNWSKYTKSIVGKQGNIPELGEEEKLYFPYFQKMYYVREQNPINEYVNQEFGKTRETKN